MKKIIFFVLVFVLNVGALYAQEPLQNQADAFRHRLGLIYNYDIFLGNNASSPWHFGAIQYEHHRERVTYVARINYAHRFGLNALQGEVEAYPKIGEKGYMYLGAGYSPHELFPSWRAGAEYFHNFPKAWEASLGFRYLEFLSPQWIPTATIGKYLGNYYISGRVFVALDKQAYTSTLLLVRKYTKDKFTFYNLMVGTGYSPDDFSRINQDLELSPALFSINVALEYQHLLKEDWLIRGGLRFNREEFISDRYRNRYGLIISVFKMF